MEKTIWPTEAKLLRLRAEGRAPVSLLLIRGVGMLGVFASLWLGRVSLPYLFGVPSIDNLAIWILPLLRLLVIPALVYLFLSFGLGFVQTRFMFRAVGTPSETNNSISSTVLQAITALFVAGFITFKLFPDVFKLVHLGVTNWLPMLAVAYLPRVVFCIVALSLFGFVGRRIAFYFKHRMTSFELKAEIASGDDEGRVDAVS